MKIRHIEHVRLAIMSAYIAATALTKEQGLLGEVNQLLENNNIPIDDITRYLSMANSLGLLVGFQLEQVTSDYERIESLYTTVVYNTAELMESLGIQHDPIKVFALFTYLYRSGYLSYNKEFKYSTNMKDLPKISGVDVVRGRGVCRSISSMFTDVCDAIGLTASNVAVKATSKALEKKEQLCPTDLKVEPNGKRFAKIVGKLTQALPIGNHLVTYIETDEVKGIFDPTNDIYMHLESGRKYSFANDTSATMSHSILSNFVPTLLSQMDCEVIPARLQRASKEEKFDYEEYKKVYKETLELIASNKQLFEEFYNINRHYYEAIQKWAEPQHGMIKRMIPVIPVIKKKNK